jgi:hypothetical protein
MPVAIAVDAVQRDWGIDCALGRGRWRSGHREVRVAAAAVDARHHERRGRAPLEHVAREDLRARSVPICLRCAARTYIVPWLLADLAQFAIATE